MIVELKNDDTLAENYDAENFCEAENDFFSTSTQSFILPFFRHMRCDNQDIKLKVTKMSFCVGKFVLTADLIKNFLVGVKRGEN